MTDSVFLPDNDASALPTSLVVWPKVYESGPTKSGTRSEIPWNDRFVSLPSIVRRSIRPISGADESNGIERLIREIWGTKQKQTGPDRGPVFLSGMGISSDVWTSTIRLERRVSSSTRDSSNFDGLDPTGFISTSREEQRPTIDRRFTVGVGHPRIRQVFARH